MLLFMKAPFCLIFLLVIRVLFETLKKANNIMSIL